MASFCSVVRASFAETTPFCNNWAEDVIENIIPVGTLHRDERPSSMTSETPRPHSPRLTKATPVIAGLTAPTFWSNGTSGLGKFYFENDWEQDEGSLEPPWRHHALSSPHTHAPDHVADTSQGNNQNGVWFINKITGLHEDVSTKRFRARELRHALRHKRDEEDDLRPASRNRLNLITPENSLGEIPSIHSVVDQLQNVTESYLVLENEYHKMEDELAQQEYKLSKRMNKLGDLFQAQALIIAAGEVGSNTSKSDDYNLDDRMPAGVEYLSSVGEVRMLQERLAGVEKEYLMIANQRNPRKCVGITLEAEALAFLGRYLDESIRSRVTWSLLIASCAHTLSISRAL